MKYKTVNYSKWNKGWRFCLRCWLPFIVISVILIAICVIKIAMINKEDKESVQISRSFDMSHIITPEPSYQIPSELLEYMAIKAIEEENVCGDETP